MFSIFKNKYYSCIINSFPESISDDVKCVLNLIPFGRYLIFNDAKYINSEKYKLENHSITLVRRFYCEDISKRKYEKLNDTQKQICCCIYLLNQNGYVREKYLRILLTLEMNEWVLPFLCNISGDYVKEILQAFYDGFPSKYKTQFIDFYKNNQKQVQKCYCRMVSYWDIYYRWDITRPCIVDGRQGVKSYIKDYIGYKLYKECFGFHQEGNGNYVRN